MITPIHSVDPVVRESSAPPEPKPQPQASTTKSGALSDDQVTLKNAGQIDHESSNQ